METRGPAKGLARDRMKRSCRSLADPATHAVAQLESWAILPEAKDEVGGIDEPPVLAAATYCNKGHLRSHQIAEGAAGAAALRRNRRVSDSAPEMDLLELGLGRGVTMSR